MKRYLNLGAMLLLAACVSGQSEPRSIDVSSSVVEPSSAIMQNIEPLLVRTSPSYVTLVVHDGSTQEISRAENLLADAVTSGSGFFIDDRGHILTAGHVAVERGWRVEARGGDGRSYRGEVVDVLPSNDLALIRLERASDNPNVTPAADPCMSVGEPVFSLGKPREQGDTARVGEVASMSFGRPVTYQGYGYPDAVVLRLQTRKGESGGPVFNRRGELTGMLVSTLSDASGTPLNLAHAVPTPNLARFVCNAIDCSASWRSLTGRDTASCPANRQSQSG